MAKRLFMTAAAVCAALAIQGCAPKSGSQTSADNAQRGNAEIQRNKQIQLDLQSRGINIERSSSDQDAFVVQDVRTDARSLSDRDLQQTQSLLKEYIANAADILSIINTPGITYGGDSWALARSAANARVALHEIEDEIRARRLITSK